MNVSGSPRPFPPLSLSYFFSDKGEFMSLQRRLIGPSLSQLHRERKEKIQPELAITEKLISTGKFR